MQQDALILYKLIVLYLLNRAAFSLSAAQVSDFLLEKEYMDFLTLRQVLGELSDAGMVSQTPVRNRTFLTITPEGQSTLHFFENRIPSDIRADVDSYLKEHSFDLRNETSVSGHYYKSSSGEFEARLAIRERDVTLLDLALSVPSLEAASAICDHWQEKSAEIYQYLTKALF